MSVKDEVVGILDGASEVYQHAVSTFMKPRGATVVKEFKDLFKANPKNVDLKTMAGITERLCKLAEAQWKGAPKLMVLCRQVKEGKVPADKAIPVANKVVSDIVALNNAVVAYDRGWRDLDDGIRKKAVFPKVYAHHAEVFEGYWKQHKGKMTLVHPPTRPTTAAPAAKPPGR